MKKITLLYFCLLGSILTSYAQFTQNFDAGTTTPAGWTVINGGDANTWFFGAPGVGTANSGTNVARINYTTSAHDDYLISPQFTVTLGVSEQLSLWAKHRSDFYAEPFDILLSSTGTATTDFTTTIATAVTPTTAWQKFTYSLAAYAGQTVYIAFRSTTTDEFELYLDDIVVGAIPNPPDYANLQWPPTATIVQGGTFTVYGRIYEAGLTDTTSGQAPGIQVWVGTNNANTDPSTWTNWTPATFNVEVGNDDEYQATIGANLVPGTYYYATRFVLNGGNYYYGGIDASNNGNFWNGTTYNSGVLTVTSPPAPANDECTGAVALTVNADFACTTVTSGTVLGSTASTVDDTACGGTEDDDVWYSFVATAATHRISLLNIAGSDADMYHSVWTGTDCGSLTLVAGSCSDGNTSNPTGLVSGQTYYVRVYTWGATAAQTTTFNICIGTTPPPATNDNFATPIAVSCGNVYTGDTSAPTTLDEDNAPDGFGADLDAPNLWYSFTGTGAAQTVTLNLCGSAYDTSVLVYTGTSGNLTLVAANDDDNTCVSNTVNSSVTFNSDGVTTYYITVEGYNAGSTGAFTMNVTCAAVNPPAVANQDCGTALSVNVDGSDTSSDNSYGTVSSAQPTCDLFGSIQDVWFSFVAPTSGTVTCLLTPGTMTSLNYVVYSGACGALTPVGNCVSNLTAADSQSYTGLTAGATYYVQVWSNAVEQGTFALRISDDGLGNDSFDSSNFSYYPNPVKNVLNLSYTEAISNVAVFNLLGQKVVANSIEANLGQVDMSTLPNGVYLVKITTATNQSKTIRVIKE
ncbi:MAG: choice-of-anchor J domain-containing protein [Flavobacterium sp.]|nr:choice-of-anchor J domain-containing protein [Flavobacterium sp.]MBP8157461.1 choice-of-anchor J domain-containing protein [Flavobacterium sp.]